MALWEPDKCNHDVDHDDATAHAYTVGRDGVAETIVFCHLCGKQIGPAILECGECGASWLEGTFTLCPWCTQTIWYAVHSLEGRG